MEIEEHYTDDDNTLPNFALLRITGNYEDRGTWSGGYNQGLDFVDISISRKEALRLVKFLGFNLLRSKFKFKT